MKPRALDLFCGAGGATRGLQLAGFHVTGVDIERQRHYVGDAFHQADALTFPLAGYDLIWASPPCQGYSVMRHLPWLRGREYPKLIEPLRARLIGSGAAYVIENVPGAPLLNPHQLCGTMFGLKVYRHRLFETNFPVLVPAHPRHVEVIGTGRKMDRHPGVSPGGFVSLQGGRKRRPNYPRVNEAGFCCVTGNIGFTELAKAAMRIDWMTRDELTQAIPPAYSEYLGTYAMLELEARATA